MSRHLITTPVEPAACGRCGTATLRGLAEGLTVQVDTEPIAKESEWRILLDGRRTYTLSPMRKELTHRTSWRIRGSLLTGAIHAEHTCRKNDVPIQLELELSA